MIAARYFPGFGGHYVTQDPVGNPLPETYSKEEIWRRDVAGFFAHAIQVGGVIGPYCLAEGRLLRLRGNGERDVNDGERYDISAVSNF